MALTHADRVAHGRIGGYTTHSRHDSAEITKNARRAFNVTKFELQVDPDGTLPLAERQKRAAAARKLFFLRLTAKSVKARRSRAEESSP